MGSSRPGTKSASSKSGKGSAKKGKKSKKEKGASVGPGASAGGGSAEGAGESKEFYTLQINELEEKLKRLKIQARETDAVVNGLKAEREQHATDQRDIVEYLNCQISQKDARIGDLESKNTSILTEKGKQQEDHEHAAAKMTQEWESNYEVISINNKRLQKELESLNEFKIQKDGIEGRLRRSVAENEALKVEHQNEVNRLDKKYIQDKDRLKKDMLQKVNEIVTNFRKISDKQMAETTKRTIRENIAINKQLQRMSSQTEDILSENKKLIMDNKSLKQNFEILKMRETEMAKNNFVARKTISILAARVKEKHNDHIEDPARLQVEEDMLDLRQDIVRVETDNVDLSERVEELEQEIEQMEREQRDISLEETRMLTVASETATFICVAMDDAQRRLERTRQQRLIERQFQEESGSDAAIDNSPADDEIMSENERLDAMSYMLSQLEMYRKARERRHQDTLSHAQVADEESAISSVEGAGSSSGTNGDHDTSMVMGMVPAELMTDQSDRRADADAAASPETKGGATATATATAAAFASAKTHPESRSVGVQTVSSQKAVFYADRLNDKGVVHAPSRARGAEPHLSSMFPCTPSGTVQTLPAGRSGGGSGSRDSQSRGTTDQLVTIRFHKTAPASGGPPARGARSVAAGAADTRKYTKVAPIRRTGTQQRPQPVREAPAPIRQGRPGLFVRVDKA